MNDVCPQPPTVSDHRLDDLAQIIRAYNQVTEKLQASHETLKSEVHRLRRELASTNAQLQRSKRLSALGEMAAGIAHEIRNPLAAIQLYAGMVIEDVEQAAPVDGAGRLCESAGENARKIAAAVRGLNGIVNDVLTFARELQPQLQPLMASDVFTAAIESQRPAIDAANVQVTIKGGEFESVGRASRPSREPVTGETPVPPGTEPTASTNLTLHADPNLLHQALANLIRNAVEAMATLPPGQPRMLSLQADQEDHTTTMTVHDTGPGIAQADIDRIFNPFFTTRNTGTGLGLAIVHRIVDAHGGSVVVHNATENGGAVFELTLPCRSGLART